MPAPPPRTIHKELELVDAPSTTLPLAPTAPRSLQVQGLLAEVKLATMRLLVRTEVSGTLTSKTSASGAPLSAPSGMAEAFLTRRTTGPRFWPLRVTCAGAKSEVQVGGRCKRSTHERCAGAFK